jgi:hypothetical protein
MFRITVADRFIFAYIDMNVFYSWFLAKPYRCLEVVLYVCTAQLQFYFCSTYLAKIHGPFAFPSSFAFAWQCIYSVLLGKGN